MRIKNEHKDVVKDRTGRAPDAEFPKWNGVDAFEFSSPLAPRQRAASTQIYLTGLIAGITVAVVFFGGTETISWAVVQILLLLMGVALLVEQLRRPAMPLRAWSAPAALLVWIAAQWLVPLAPVASLDRWATSELFVRLLVYGCAFAVAREVGRDAKTAQRLVLALIVLGLVEAAYGLVQYLTGWQKIFWYEKVYYRESATGTYINHNHFAGFLEMVIPFAVAMALAARARARHRQPHAPSGKAALFFFLATLLVLAVVFSQSRMGLLSCTVSLAAMAAVLGLRRRFAGGAPGAGFGVGMIAVLLAAALALVLWIGVEPVIDRFAALPGHEGPQAVDRGRLLVWADTLRLIRAHPVFGVGLGAFEAAYTRVQTVGLDARVDYAHNDYLQLAAELGPAGALVFWGILFTLGARTLRACWTSPEGLRLAIALGATGALVALLLHSLTDFNLYVPANGLLFAVVLGLGSSCHREVETHPAAEERRLIRMKNKM